MRVLVTGHEGYLGGVLVPMLLRAGHDLVGLDNGLFRHCLYAEEPQPIPTLDMDIRDVEAAQLQGSMP